MASEKRRPIINLLDQLKRYFVWFFLEDTDDGRTIPLNNKQPSERDCIVVLDEAINHNKQDGGKCLSMHKFDSINHVSI